MKQTHHFLARRIDCILLLFFLLVCHITNILQALPLSKKEAKIPPRIRIASYASSTIGTNFLEPGHLGLHGYRYSFSERNGIVYTAKAGHIDIAHVRKAADWTAFLAAKTFQHLKNNKTEFSFKLYEPSLYFVQLTYPQYWQCLSRQQKECTAYEISIRLGQYLAYTASVWHEILTWFGYKGIGFYPEFPSAFSWEDVFSNALGTHIAALAIRDTEREFSQAVTLALDSELEVLGVQSKHTARRAAEKVRGLWFSGDLLFVDIKKRNFDIGLDDGFVTPWIVPSVSGCDRAEAQGFPQGGAPQPYPVPNLDFVSDYGFSVKLEIEPREWEKGSILKVVYPDVKRRRKRLQPAIHFAPIMKYIVQDAIAKYGPDVGSP